MVWFKSIVIVLLLSELVVLFIVGGVIASVYANLETSLQHFFESISLNVAKVNDQQSQVDEKLDAFGRLLDRQTTHQHHQWNEFNSLARADMRNARQGELTHAKELKFALERLMGVALTSRQPASPNDVIALEKLNRRIDELEALLSDNKQPN